MRVLLIWLLIFTGAPLEARTLTIAAEEFWPPYIDPSLPEGGLVLEVTIRALEKVGHEVEVVWLPWSRALRETRAGLYDGLAGCYYTPERTKDLTYPEPAITTEMVFFKLKEHNIKFSTLNDLRGQRIGVIRNYTNTPEFDAADYLIKDVGEDATYNIRKLLAGRVDLIIGNRGSIQNIIDQRFPLEAQRIEVLKPILESKMIFTAFSSKRQGHQTIVNDFNRGLKLIKDDGTYDRILSSYGFKW